MVDELPALAAPLLPQLFFSPYDEYDEEERAHHRYLWRLDVAGVLCTTAAYVGAALRSAPEGLEALRLPSPPVAVHLVQTICAALAVYVLYVQLFVMVRATKATVDDFHVAAGPFGRWIWLTHQTIALVAVHAVVSLLAPYISERLAAGTYVAAMTVGGLGTFVTVQFFSLVRGHPDYVKDCRVWASRGVHYYVINSVVHLPHLPLAIADVCVFKQRAGILLLAPSVLSILAVFGLYCVAYVLAIHVNHAITGFWPYGLLKELGKSPTKWGQFILVQCGVLTIFALGLWTLPRVTPAVW